MRDCDGVMYDFLNKGFVVVNPGSTIRASMIDNSPPQPLKGMMRVLSLGGDGGE